jgi:membrane protein DedA with SNARE-associated domain
MPKLAEFLLTFDGPTAYALVFVILLACGFGIPIPEDITLIAAGILAYYKAARVEGMIAVGLVGVLIGDGTMFFLGRKYGLTLARHKFLSKIVSEDRLALVSDVLANRGTKILFGARFMPGLRSPLFFTAGAVGVKPLVFLLYDGLAALISVPAIVFSVYYFGSEMEKVIATIERANQGIVVTIATASVVIFYRWKKRQKQTRLGALKAANAAVGTPSLPKT